MQKTVMALVAAGLLFTVGAAGAQVGKAASSAADAVEHKIDQKRADSDAKKSGPVGKVVNKAKSGYHKSRARNSSAKAKSAAKNAL